jgi:Ca-activated chloride channel family protein
MDLVNDLHGFEIGVMAYAGEATMLAPLTFERDFLLQSIGEAGPNDVSRGGTNFSNAFYEAVAILGPMTYSPKLLLTDGEDLEGDARHVAKQIKDAGIQIVPVAIGTEAGAPMVVKNEDDSSDYVRDLSARWCSRKCGLDFSLISPKKPTDR